jgi:hypothetical protein
MGDFSGAVDRGSRFNARGATLKDDALFIVYCIISLIERFMNISYKEAL